jgi:hypothetical protein
MAAGEEKNVNWCRGLVRGLVRFGARLSAS